MAGDTVLLEDLASGLTADGRRQEKEYSDELPLRTAPRSALHCSHPKNLHQNSN
jgi:hypothetical protein